MASPSRIATAPPEPTSANSFKTLVVGAPNSTRWSDDEENETTSVSTLIAAEQSYLQASGGKVNPKDPLGKLIKAKQKQARKEDNQRREAYNTRQKAKAALQRSDC